jgi:flavin reductase (DIM6/NTAB) family NADH-FMN oxidoreductase RutF
MSDLKREYREVMSRWATGVTVVGAAHDGRFVGLVASSFTSVSADPPTILVCVDQRSKSLGAIEASGAFSVNVLTLDQQRAFRVFAGMEGTIEDKFTASGEHVESGKTGSPILKSSLAWLDCRVVAKHPGGTTHVILIGEVVECGTEQASSPHPLIYFYRATHRLATE